MALAAIVLNILEQSSGPAAPSVNSWLGKSLASGMARYSIWLIVMLLLADQMKG